MKNILNNKKAQSTLEFAVLIVCIVGALIAMQFYISRSIQGRHRRAADGIGEQYDPRGTNGDTTDTFISNSTTVVNSTDINGLASSTTQAVFNESHQRVGSESVAALP